MTQLAILSPKEIKKFDTPPNFTPQDRLKYFALNKDELKLFNKIRTPTNKIGFLLQLGYFKSTSKFFPSSHFKKKDTNYIARIYNIDLEKVNFDSYQQKLPLHHRHFILQELNWRAFDTSAIKLLRNYIKLQIQNNLSVKDVFYKSLDFLLQNKIEIPTYRASLNIITEAYKTYEIKLVEMVQNHSISDGLELLQEFMHKLIESPLYFKNINQSLKPYQIQESLEAFKEFKKCFTVYRQLIDTLELSHSSIEYYATWVHKAESTQLKSIKNQNKLNLYLLSFVCHQYYQRQDTLVDILLKSVRASINAARNTQAKIDGALKSDRTEAFDNFVKDTESSQQVLEHVCLIIKDTVLSQGEKLVEIERLVDKWQNQNQFIHHKVALNKIEQKSDWYDTLESQSIKLQRRVSNIILLIEFNPLTSDSKIIKAIDYFKLTEGNITNKAPISFVKDKEKEALFRNNSFRKPLYKILLFIHIADALKSGKLNLNDSYRYKALYEYLIPESIWAERKAEFLKEAELEGFADFETTIYNLSNILNRKYKSINESLSSNKYLSFDNKEKVKIITPKVDNQDMEYIPAILNELGQVTIYEVLTTIDYLTAFSKGFKHFSIKYSKMKPTLKTICAGIMGLGLNHGIHRMAHISEGISEKVLRNTINWFFTLKNLEEACTLLAKKIDSLRLPEIYKKNSDQLHTGSDGRKINVAIESLHANYSFKYFGKNKGVSLYSFLDERQLLFYSTVISTSEREAAYVIDGLLHNDIPKSTIHSTDTHGFTETIFAITHFIGVSFAPRFKKIKAQRLYSFEPRKYYAQKGYKILPSKKINLEIMHNNWDDILRFIVTIKLKHTPASLLLKRLSSYSKDNPLYKGIKEFGRITKSSFILTYFQDVELRQTIEKILNMVELSNNFSKAISFANNQEFQQASKEEQQIIAACIHLIQNAIILWNYLYLSQKFVETTDIKERQKMIRLFQKGSVLCWRHINFHGEYNFNKTSHKKSPFDMEKIEQLKL